MRRFSLPVAACSALVLATILTSTGCGEANTSTRPPVKVIAFDENEMVIEGIRNGSVVGTVVQNPYMYGYKSIEVLSELHKGNTDVIPENKFIDIPARVVLKDAGSGEFHGAEAVSADAFWDDLQAKLNSTGDAASAEAVPAAGEQHASFAFITNAVADFWTIGETGANHAARDFNVKVNTIMPQDMADQTRKIEDSLSRGIDGIALSAIDPANQGEIINGAAKKAHLITADSDAPDSDRLVYIGMDNYDAGVLCGQLVREALPDGGKVMLFIGRLDQDNAQRRRQGCIDGIFGRTPDQSHQDPVNEVLTSEDGKYVILGTLTDNTDRAKAKANAEDTLTRHPDIAAMVGLFEYNPPLIMEALDRAGRLGGE